MKSLLTSTILSCFCYLGYCQKNGVSIIEEVTPKRTFLYAENTSQTSKNVFLKVEATGYRRRSDRPLIESIPAESKKLLITLIPLANADSKYTYTYVVNDETENLHGLNVEPKKKAPNN